MQDLLDRPALLLAAFAAAGALGSVLGGLRGAAGGLLLATAAAGVLLSWGAYRFGLPDAAGFFLTGLGLAAAGLVLAWRALRGGRIRV